MAIHNTCKFGDKTYVEPATRPANAPAYLGLSNCVRKIEQITYLIKKYV